MNNSDKTNNILKGNKISPHTYKNKSMNFFSFIQKDSNFYSLVHEKLNDEDLKKITRKKLFKNITCEEIDDLLSKSDQLLDFIENQETTQTLTQILTSLDLINELLKKIIILQRGESGQNSDTYQGFIYYFIISI